MTKNPANKSTTKKRVVKKKAIPKSPAKKSAAKKKTIGKNKRSASKKTVRAGNEINLKAVLSISDAKTLYAEFGKKLESNKNILINASAVEMVDTAILQLLLAFIQKSQLQNIAVEWVKPSKELISRSETLNLTRMLGLSEGRG